MQEHPWTAALRDIPDSFAPEFEAQDNLLVAKTADFCGREVGLCCDLADDSPATRALLRKALWQAVKVVDLRAAEEGSKA